MLNSPHATTRTIILLLPTLFFAIIALAPILLLIEQSSISQRGINFDSYVNALSSSRQIMLLKNSVTLALTTTILSATIGVTMGFLVSRTDMPCKRAVKILSFLPLIIPSYVGAVAWIQLLGKAGIINVFIMHAFHVTEPFFSVYGLGGAILVLTAFTYPYAMFFTIIALKSINPQLEEAARLYTSTSRALTRITLPLIAPAILASATLVFIYVLSDFGVVSFLQYNTYTLEIYSQFNAFQNTASATASSTILAALTAGALILFFTYMRRREYVTVSSASGSSSLIELGFWKHAATLFCFIVVFLTVILPLSALFYCSIHPSPLIPILTDGGYTAGKGVSLENYRLVVGESLSPLANSIFFAAAGATVIVAVSLFVGYFIARDVKCKLLSNVFLMLPYMVPGTILGLGLILLWNKPGLGVYGTPLIIMIGYFARFSPLATKAVESNISQISFTLEEAALVSGASWGKSLWRIIIPLVKPGLLVAWMLVFVLCMGELSTTIMVYPPGYSTLPLSIFTLQHDGPPSLVAALSITLVALTLLSALLFYAIVKRVYNTGFINEVL